MRFRSAITVGLVGLLTVAAAACGDDDDDGTAATTTAGGASATTTGGSAGGGDASSATEADYLAAIETQFTASGADSLELTEEQAGCVAPKWLEVITIDKLKEKGITPDDVRADSDNEKLATLGLSDADAEKMYAAFGDCDVDVREKVSESLIASTEQGPEVDACFKDAMSEDLVQRMFVVSITKGQAGLDADEELTTELFGALEKCVPTTTT